MLPRVTVHLFGDILEREYREYIEGFPWRKKEYDTKATLLRNEPEVYIHSFFDFERRVIEDGCQESENLRLRWGKEVSFFMVMMSEICWQEQYVAQARIDLASRTKEEMIPEKTVRVFEKALEFLLRDYPLSQHTLDLLRAEPEVCIHARFVAMRQIQLEDGVQWYAVGDPAIPKYSDKARYDLQETAST